ncbi:MAG: DNA translocase FtsK, partial [Bacteroidota bacterium]|nr:DNA translocase FtsK [Bacteroidota bacterium]
MANTRKNKKNKSTPSSKMKADIEEKVEVKKLLKDERSHKIAGTLLILIAFLLFVSFTSYLFTWQEDQSKVFKGAKILLPSHAEPMANLLGTGGAYFSDLFFRSGFGIASYLFCTFFFVAGINLFSPKKKFSLSRNIRYVIVGLLVISVSASFLMKGHPFPWGGVAGDMASGWLQQVIGRVGTAALLLAAMFSYIIWRFNPSFNFQNRNDRFDSLPGKSKVEEMLETSEEKAEEKILGLNSPISPLTTNPLKEDNGVNHDFQVFERMEENQLREEKNIILIKPTINETGTETRAKSAGNGLMLEVKTVPEIKEDETEKAAVVKPNIRQPYDPILDLRSYKFPGLDLLEAHGSEKIVQDVTELETNKNQIINTLKNYDIEIQKISATVGPTVTLYEIVPAPGVRISRIKNLEDDIALSLAALGIRIIAPIPGKGTIGIEVPNVKKTVVSMKTLLNSDKFQKNHFSLPIAIGKKIDNENFIVDLTTMPHLLMAGATGQGKSVGLNAILVSLLYKKHPSQLKFVLIDPKKVELSIYQSIEKHFLAKLPGEEDAIITDTKKVIHTLNALCIEMDNRYDLLKEAGTRNIKEYNEKFVSRKLNPEKGHQYLPFIVLVIDEFADLIMTAGKEVEMPIARLAQLARAVGIHLIIATQRPSVNIITGTIKANFPARIAFKVSSKIDSRTILDIGGAEQLIGKGDMLISYNGELTRLQCAFVDTPEVDKVTDFIGEQQGYAQAFMLPEYVDEKEFENKDFDVNDRDPLFEDAAKLIVMSQSGSTSLLQRKMKLGYNRAGRLMDQLEAAGVVGPNQGSKVRDVLIKTDAELQQYL